MSGYASMFGAVALSFSSMVMAHAADRTQAVKFAPGATSATISGSLKGYDMNTYLLGARSGQTLTVRFKPSNSSCYYNVDGPDGGDSLFNGSVASGDFSGVLPADGKYQIKPYLMRNAARRNETCKFSITFEIRD